MNSRQPTSTGSTYQLSPVLSCKPLEFLFLSLADTAMLPAPAPNLGGDEARRPYLGAMDDCQHVVIVEHMRLARHRGSDVPHNGHHID